MKSRLPNLVFFETHDDTVTTRIIAKLIPELGNLGYDLFFEECPNGKFFSCSTRQKCQSLEEAKEKGLNELILSAQDLMRHTAVLEPNLGITQTDIENDDLFDKAEFLKGRFAPTPAFTKALYAPLNADRGLSPAIYYEIYAARAYLVEQLLKFNIAYKGSEDADRPEEVPEIYDPIREYEMAAVFATAKEHFIARNGLQHVNGLQMELVKQLTYAKAAQKFLMYYIYSQPMHDDEPNKKLFEQETQARACSLDLPLGLTSIDATKHTDDAIISMILKAVKRKALHEARENDTTTFFSAKLGALSPSLPDLKRRNSF